MEMKYLREQDTGQIYLPVVHASGIVGLTTYKADTCTKYTAKIEDTEQGVTGDIEVFEYNKILVGQIELNFKDNSLALTRLANGNSIVVDCKLGLPFIFTPLIFDTLSYEKVNDKPFPSYKVDTSITLSANSLSIVSSTKRNNYKVDNVGLTYNEPETLKLTKVIGTANGISLDKLEVKK